MTCIPLRTSEIRSCKNCIKFNDNCGTTVNKAKLHISAINCQEFKINNYK